MIDGTSGLLRTTTVVYTCYILLEIPTLFSVKEHRPGLASTIQSFNCTLVLKLKIFYCLFYLVYRVILSFYDLSMTVEAFILCHRMWMLRVPIFTMQLCGSMTLKFHSSDIDYIICTIC